MVPPTIINADDFGLSTATNLAIKRAHQAGILTHVSLLANFPALDDAIKISQENPRLSVGVHLNLTIGKPLSPANQLPLLTNHAGYFHRNFVSLLFLSFLRPQLRSQIHLEFEAQIKKVLSLGIRPTHLDSQEHVHMIPMLFTETQTLATQYHIPRLRISRDIISPISLLPHFPPVSNVLKYLLLWALSILNLPHHTPSHFHYTGVTFSGKMTLPILNHLLQATPHSLPLEISLHPGLKESYIPHFFQHHLRRFLQSPRRQAEYHALISLSRHQHIRQSKRKSYPPS